MDIYSLGIVMWEIETREIPFADSNLFNTELELMISINGLRPTINKENKNWDENYIYLMESCWQVNPFHRPSAEQVSTELKKVREGKIKDFSEFEKNKNEISEELPVNIGKLLSNKKSSLTSYERSNLGAFSDTFFNSDYFQTNNNIGLFDSSSKVIPPGTARETRKRSTFGDISLPNQSLFDSGHKTTHFGDQNYGHSFFESSGRTNSRAFLESSGRTNSRAFLESSGRTNSRAFLESSGRGNGIYSRNFSVQSDRKQSVRSEKKFSIYGVKKHHTKGDFNMFREKDSDEDAIREESSTEDEDSSEDNQDLENFLDN